MPRRRKALPKTLGGCADRLQALRQEKAKLNKELQALDAEYKELKEKLIQELPKSQAEGVTGRQARAKIVTKHVPSVKDWGRFYKYVARTKSFDLLQRRVSEAAVKERWEAKKQVPGVEPYQVVTVSVTKK